MAGRAGKPALAHGDRGVAVRIGPHARHQHARRQDLRPLAGLTIVRSVSAWRPRRTCAVAVVHGVASGNAGIASPWTVDGRSAVEPRNRGLPLTIGGYGSKGGRQRNRTW